MALAEARRTGTEIAGLLTTVSETTGRSSMHGVRPALLVEQASVLSLPIEFVVVPEDGSNESYERVMHEALAAYANDGVDSVIFADLFLEDIRSYREELLSEVGLAGEWPLWHRDTTDLIEAFIRLGFRATIEVVDGERLPPAFLGRELTPALIDALPEHVDPCGENGEFHTFVWDGPPFDDRVSIVTGRRVTRELDGTAYLYIDMLSAPGG